MIKIRYIDNNNEEITTEYTLALQHTLDSNNTQYEIGRVCEHCGNFIPDGEEKLIRDDESYYVCEDCLNNLIDTGDIFCCDCCNYYFDSSVANYTTHDNEMICEDCLNTHYRVCEGCGELYFNDYLNYCDECDSWFCDYCWDDHEHDTNLLYDYHSFNNWQPHALDDEQPAFYIGHELEIDDGDNMYEAVSLITNRLNGICMHDGSLSSEGIEFISHPLSYNYMLSIEDKYRNVFSELINLGYKSHETDTCGLHFHVTRPDDEVVDRIILFMETYKDEIIQLSRRKRREIDSWCNFLSDKRYNTDEKVLKSLDYIKKNKETSTRYMALNLTNSRTIEFRIFKGTLKYETFMADFEFVYFLTTLCSNLSIPITDITWRRVTSMGKFLPQYVHDHNIFTDKPIIDYSTEILIARNKEKEEIKKELISTYKKTIKSLHDMTKLDTRKKEVVLIDVNMLNNYSSWIDCLIRDISNLDNTFDMNDDYYINEVKRRLNYIKERI